MHKIGHPHRCHSARHHRPHHPRLERPAAAPGPAANPVDRTQFSAEAASWRDTLPENFRNYVSERSPQADNNQAAGIMALLTQRLRQQ